MAFLQMTWQPNLLHQKRKTGPPLGLKNLGNTCYLNSVLQCLTYTPPLANFCLKFQHSSSCDSGVVASEKKSECPFCILEKRIARSLSIDSTLDSPVKINNCLKIFAQHFRCGRQEDAHEFLRYVIDACHNTCLRLKKLQQRRKSGGGPGCGTDGNGSTVVKDIFGGALQSQVKCLSCGAESNKVDEIMDISLDVLLSSSLKDALQKFFQPEILDGNNKYKCDNCKKLVAARKQMSIVQAPNVLVIQLKRFEGIYGGKIDKAISFEDVLLLSSYMCKGSQDPSPEYNLFGTIVHSGFSSDSGHYYAYIKDAMGRWYCCNDSYVTLSTLQEVLSEKVYILFFSRSKQRPSAAKNVNLANGLKCRESNGNGIPRTQKLEQVERPMNMKQVSRHSQETVSSTSEKVDKVPSSPQKKLSIFSNSGANKLPANGNVKFVVHKKEATEKSGSTMTSIHREDKDKSLRPLIHRNGASKIKEGNSGDAEMISSLPLTNGNGKHCSASDITMDGEDNCRTDKLTLRKAANKELCNGNLNCPSDESHLKRKAENGKPCILLAKDAQACAQVERFKEGLRKEASLILQSCGWTDEVHKFMHSRKKFCAREAGNGAMNIDEIKKLLIAEAKRNFISQIPESLKGSLIESLRSFSQEELSPAT